MLHAPLYLHPLRPLIRRTLAAAALALLAACATPPDEPVALPPDLPPRAEVSGVPLVVQDDFFCGPAALSMALGAAGFTASQQGLAALAFTPAARGSFQSDMLGAARRSGALALTVEGEGALLRQVAAGRPVIVFQNLGLPMAPAWHYGVVTGYDAAAGRITLHSGAREVMVMPWSAFRESWARGGGWAMLALAPADLPEDLPPRDLLDAAAALEVVEPAAAEAAYRAGMARWPRDWLWPFGLANARYAQGDLKGARAALLLARGIAPDVREIRANLAQVTRELSG